LPFALWDLDGLIRGVALLQPFRADSLSLPALLAHLRPGYYGQLAFLGLALGAMLLTACLRRSTPLLQAVAAAAASWFVIVLFARQSFCNYYWLCVGLLCATVAVRSREPA
jgi:hypothetical protein